MAGKAVAAVKGMLERVGIKAPWKASCPRKIHTAGSHMTKTQLKRLVATAPRRSPALRPLRSSWTTCRLLGPSERMRQRKAPPVVCLSTVQPRRHASCAKC